MIKNIVVGVCIFNQLNYCQCKYCIVLNIFIIFILYCSRVICYYRYFPPNATGIYEKVFTKYVWNL